MTSKTSGVRIAAKERRIRALQLRIAGATHKQIGQQLGCSEQRAWKIITEELSRLNEECAELTEQVRRLELERLDAMARGCWPKAQAGNVSSVDRILKIMERRSKLLGLESPERIEHSGNVQFIRMPKHSKV